MKEIAYLVKHHRDSDQEPLYGLITESDDGACTWRQAMTFEMAAGYLAAMADSRHEVHFVNGYKNNENVKYQALFPRNSLEEALKALPQDELEAIISMTGSLDLFERFGMTLNDPHMGNPFLDSRIL